MRFVDTSELVSLAPDGAGPWRMGEDKLLRMLSGHHVIPTEEQAQSMLEVYRAVAAKRGRTRQMAMRWCAPRAATLWWWTM